MLLLVTLLPLPLPLPAGQPQLPAAHRRGAAPLTGPLRGCRRRSGAWAARGQGSQSAVGGKQTRSTCSQVRITTSHLQAKAAGSARASTTQSQSRTCTPTFSMPTSRKPRINTTGMLQQREEPGRGAGSGRGRTLRAAARVMPHLEQPVMAAVTQPSVRHSQQPFHERPQRTRQEGEIDDDEAASVPAECTAEGQEARILGSQEGLPCPANLQDLGQVYGQIAASKPATEGATKPLG